MFRSEIGSTGTLNLRVLRGGSLSATPARELTLWEVLKYGVMASNWPMLRFKLRNLPNLWRGAWRVFLARFSGIPTHYGSLSIVVRRADGRIEDYGLVSLRVVTTVGAGFIVDAFQNLVEVELMKFHALGTGTNAEAAGDTSLQTELTTQYIVNSIRATGTTTEGASANIYRTVATNTVDASAAVTEHGILSDEDVGQGVLLDRSVFSAINLASADSLQSTFDLTFATGG